MVERDEVVKQAKAMPPGEQEVHFGYLFGIMVEKGSEFPEGDPRRYFKYRVVFQGNNVRDQNWDVALFNEMASTPATMEASRIADIYSCFPGCSVEGRDVEQAYLQAEMEGPPVYITNQKNYGQRRCTRCETQWSNWRRHFMTTNTPVYFGRSFVPSKLLQQASNL